MFASNDLRFEIIMNSLIEILESKKMPDGTPFFAPGELEKKAEEISKKTLASASIDKPNSGLIIPGGSGLLS